MAKSYPESIAPREGYRYRLPMRKLIRDYPELTVARRCDDPEPFVYSGTGRIKKLKDELFANENLLEMSVNLLGGPLKLSHLPFVPHRELVQEDWSGKQLFDFSQTDDFYRVEEPCGVIYFGVSQTNTFTFPYPKSMDRKDYGSLKAIGEKTQRKENIKSELVGAFGGAGNGMTEMYAWLRVNHHPNVLNYWHMQIDVYGVNHDGYFKHDEKSAEARRVRQQLREHITHIAICEAGTAYHIGRKYYRRGTGWFTNASDIVTNLFCHEFQRYKGTY